MNVEIGELPPKERQILYLVYQLAPVTVLDVQQNLKHEASYNSIRRILDSLVEKKLVTFERVKRKYVYSPVRSRSEQGTKMLQEVIKTFFDESPALGFVNLIKGRRDENLQDLEIENIKSLLDDYRKAAKKPE